MSKPGRWRSDPTNRARWERNQHRKKPTREEHQGPKYQEYFYAYSNRMLSSAVMYPACDAAMMEGSLGDEFRRYGELVQVELPLIGSDSHAKYGLLFVPEQRTDVLRELGAPHRKIPLGPRIMHSPDTDIALLADNWLPKGWKAEMLAEELEGLTALAYREPFAATPLCEYLGKERFSLTTRVEYGMKLLPGRSPEKAREESKKPLHFNFYSIPLVLGPVIDVPTVREIGQEAKQELPASEQRYVMLPAPKGKF